MVNGSLSGLSYAIDRLPGMSCVICHAVDRAMFFRTDEPSVVPSSGICEPCASAVHWAWRQLAGEIPPGFPPEDLKCVSTVYALIARRREVPRLDAPPVDGEQVILAPAELNSSWEFLLAKNGDGIFSPPSISSDSHPDMRDQSKAALAALSSVSLSSWPALAEPLFTSYSPRGRLVGVVLIRGWADQFAVTVPTLHPDLSWSPWPLSAHTGPMAGFWRALETVWTLRLHKHCVVDDHGELCVRLREAACRYIELQIALRAGKAFDASMSAIYKSSMSVDELAVERLIQLAEERARGARGGRSLAVIPRGGEGKRGTASPVPARRGSSIAPWDDPAGEADPGSPDGETGMDDPVDDGGSRDGDSADDDSVSDDDNDNDDDIPGPEWDPPFVRPGRPLKR